MRFSKFYSAVAPLALASAFAIATAAGGAARAADAVVVPGATDFPESMTATSDGTLYFSSFGNGRIWRAKPGETTASEFIKSGSNGLASALGVLADEKSNTLFVCSNDFSAAGIKIPGGTPGASLKTFDLKTGEAKGSVSTPAAASSLCNDIVVGGDGTAYVADSFAGRILRLKPGAKEFEVWATDERWNVPGKPQLDGIAIVGDAIYSNIFEGDGLYRVPMNADGSAGKATKLETSRPLYHSDGMKAFGPNQLIQVEGETKGNLDLITIDGDKAKIETIKSGFDGPVGLSQVGDQIYVLDVPLRYLLGPEAKEHKPPPPFKATPVPAPK